MLKKKECCGCTACEHVCPVNCISMVEDEEGFLYPVIREEKCMHCHKCENVCPVRYPEKGNNGTTAYVGYYTDADIRRNSSSGGIFTAVAEWILEQGGVVFGAAYDENFEVHHVAVEKKEELEQLRGSKYVQSRLENAYPKVRKYLEAQRKVLFTGTACQIAGLKKYLGKDYGELYTADVLCHGVPSPKIWRMYLENHRCRQQSSVKTINLRDKKDGWKNYAVKIEFSNQNLYELPHGNDPFFRMFLTDIALRPSCYACRFKEMPRISDLTMGDCWGVENSMPDMDDDQGTSVILVHSAKGDRLLLEIEKNLIIKEATLDDVLSPTADSRKSVREHPNKMRFWKAVTAGQNFEELDQYVRKSFIQKVVGYIQNRIEEWKIGKKQ